MSTENTRERRIQLIFGQYPQVDEFHFTSDDQAFFSRSDAYNHARSLANKHVETVTRSGKKSPSTEQSDNSSPLSAREHYKQLFGKKPGPNWSEETVAKKIAEKEAESAAKSDGPNESEDDAGSPDGSQEEE